MKYYEIKLTDIQRILFGEVPASFFIEVVIRTICIYTIILIAMRLMGKRMSSHLSRSEMAAMVSVAAAIGVPIQTPDRGLLPVIVITAVVISFQVWVAKKSASNKKFEEVSQDDIAPLVKDGVLDLHILSRNRLTRDRLFAQLRSCGIIHLGMVKRCYLEANGSFSLIKSVEPLSGLPIIPESDIDFYNEVPKVETLVCNRCGQLQPVENPQQDCPNCHASAWRKAAQSDVFIEATSTPA